MRLFYVDNREVDHVVTKQASAHISALPAVPGTMRIRQVITTKKEKSSFLTSPFFVAFVTAQTKKTYNYFDLKTFTFPEISITLPADDLPVTGDSEAERTPVIEPGCVNLLSAADSKQALFHLTAKNDIAAGSELIVYDIGIIASSGVH